MVNETLSPLRRFFKLLQLDRKDIFYIYLYAALSGVITLTLPLGIQAIIGFIASGSLTSSWGVLIFVVTVGTALAGILEIMQLGVTETLQRRIFTRVSFDFAYRFPRFPAELSSRIYLPELVNRFFDTLTLQKGLPKILMDLSTAILQIIFGLILISFYHPFFVFFSFFLLLVVALIFVFTAQKGLDTSLKESKYKYLVAHWLEELAQTMMTFKLSGYSDLPLKRVDKLVVGYLDARHKHFKVLLQQFGGMVFLKTVFTTVLLALGSILIIENQINIGQFVAAEIVVILVISSVGKLIVTMETVYDVLTALEKLGTVTDMPFEQPGGIPFAAFDKGNGIGVQLDNIDYVFPDTGKKALDGINLQIRPGERICLAGYNGGGKSTLVRIIARLYTEYQGSLSYNGFPAGNIDPASLRKHIGDHSAYEDIFSGSILENITLGDESIHLETVLKVIEEIRLRRYIQSLPEGINTHLLTRGKNIPRSIIKKIILARSMVCNPSLLALEDPFRNMESADRMCIADCLTDKRNNWTLVAISSDPYFASKCDRILVMKEGQIIEDGTFEAIRSTPHFEKIFHAEAD